MSAAHQQAPEAAVAPPPGHPRFALFDGLRAIAALSVLVFHAAQAADAIEPSATWWEPVAARLAVGVPIFFVISGFLLYRPFVAGRYGGPARPAFRAFARRRFLRIVPGYWFILVATLPLAVVPYPGGFWRYFAFAQVYGEETFSGGIGQAWSLCVELGFYVLLPLYVLAAARLVRGRPPGVAARIEVAGLAALAATSVAFSVAVFMLDEPWLSFSLPGTFCWFAAGMALAVMSARRRDGSAPRLLAPLAARPKLAWGLALLLIAAPGFGGALPGFTEEFAADLHPAQWALVHVTYGAVALLVVIPAVFRSDHRGGVRRLLRTRVVAWVGLVSYGVYLWHGVVIGWWRFHGPDELFGTGFTDGRPGLVFALLAAVTLAATLPLAALSYSVVERPFLRLKHRPARRRRAPASARVPAA